MFGGIRWHDVRIFNKKITYTLNRNNDTRSTNYSLIITASSWLHTVHGLLAEKQKFACPIALELIILIQRWSWTGTRVQEQLFLITMDILHSILLSERTCTSNTPFLLDILIRKYSLKPSAVPTTYFNLRKKIFSEKVRQILGLLGWTWNEPRVHILG